MKHVEKHGCLGFGLVRLGTSLTMLALASGCSLASRDTNHLQITMPEGGFGPASSRMASSLSADSLIPKPVNSSSMSFPTPLSLDEFTCFGVIVTGSDIPADPRMSQQCKPVDSAGNPIAVGVIGGLAAVAGGTVDLQVPSGSARTIQLFGIQSLGGCPDISQILGPPPTGTVGAVAPPPEPTPTSSPTGGQGGDKLGDPFLLAQVTQDIFSDITIPLQARYSAGAQPLFKCSNDHGGNNGPSGPTIGIGLPNGSGAIKANTCASVGLNAQNANGTLPPAVFLVVSGSTNTQFYYDSASCSSDVNRITGPVTFAVANPNIQLYVKSGDAVGAQFDVQLQPASGTAPGWFLQGQHFNVVNDGLSLAGGSFTPGTCSNLMLQTINYVPLPAGMQFSVRMGRQGNGPQPAPSLQLYSSSADCAGGVNAVPGQVDPYGISFVFTSPSASTHQYLWVKDPISENLYVSVSMLDNSMQPTSANAFFGTPLSWDYVNFGIIAYLNAPFNAPAVVHSNSISSCSVSPPLPAGLGFNPSTCMISGTPTAAQGALGYTVTAYSSDGQSAPISITLQVLDAPFIQYSGAQIVMNGGPPYAPSFLLNAPHGTAVSTVIATNQGDTIDTPCTWSGTLPSSGLVLAANCSISGTLAAGIVTYTGMVAACHTGNCEQIPFTINAN